MSSSVEIPASAGVVAHPLEPLTADEIAAAVAILRDQRNLPESIRFSYVALDEPTKEELDAYAPGSPVERRAAAVMIDRATGTVSESIVSVGDGAVLSWRDLSDVQPALLFEDCFDAILAVKEDPRWQEAMRRRGSIDFDTVPVARSITTVAARRSTGEPGTYASSSSLVGSSSAT